MTAMRRESGFALALLLWMIAGMALMVTAVIHFAQSDIQMAELRVSEAKTLAIARGAALVVLRDQVLVVQDDAADEAEAVKPFRREYVLVEGTLASATIRPPNAYTSLNDADIEELAGILRGAGRLAAGTANILAERILDYRDISSEASLERLQFDGFRAREELLAVEGFPRGAYDLIKDLVHPYRTGALDLSTAGAEVAEALLDEDQLVSHGNSSSRDRSSGTSGARAGSGAVTFDAIWEQKRRDSMGLGMTDSVRLVEVEVKTDAGAIMRQRIWLSGAGDSIVRAEPARLKTAGVGD